jgi:hypothetical protein
MNMENLYTQVIYLENMANSKNVKENEKIIEFSTILPNVVDNLHSFYVDKIYYSNDHYRFTDETENNTTNITFAFSVEISDADPTNNNGPQTFKETAGVNSVVWNSLMNDYRASKGVPNNTIFGLIFKSPPISIPNGNYTKETLLMNLNTILNNEVIFSLSLVSYNGPSILYADKDIPEGLKKYRVIMRPGGITFSLPNDVNVDKTEISINKVYNHPNNSSQQGNNNKLLWYLNNMSNNTYSNFFLQDLPNQGPKFLAQQFAILTDEKGSLPEILGFPRTSYSSLVKYVDEREHVEKTKYYYLTNSIYKIDRNYAERGEDIDLKFYSVNYNKTDKQYEKLNIHSSTLSSKLITLPSLNVKNVNDIIYSGYHTEPVGNAIVENVKNPILYRFKKGASLNDIQIYISNENSEYKITKQNSSKLSVNLVVNRYM